MSGHGATPKKTMCPLWSDNDTLHKVTLSI